MSTKIEFKISERVVYPAHGIGEIVAIESQKIANTEIQVYVVSFTQDKMMLKIPINRAAASGLRTLVSKADLNKIYTTLNSKPKPGNRMWSRRAQEYEAKINSGEIVAIAEVLRDLYKGIDTDRSYSERMIYESALNRLASEIAILENITLSDAVEKLIDLLKHKAAA
jgi:CarD family transcriptional regulator